VTDTYINFEIELRGNVKIVFLNCAVKNLLIFSFIEFLWVYTHVLHCVGCREGEIDRACSMYWRAEKCSGQKT
jgi:hypothetical protein